MRFDKRVIIEAQRAVWWIITHLLPREEPEPRNDYPPPPEGIGGGESLVVRPSLIPGAGLGLFTTRPHAAYEVLCLYTGERLTRWQQLRSQNTQYFAQTAAGVVCCRKYLNIKARYINHHFDPTQRNVVLASYPDAGAILGRCRFYVSTREIKPGEELYGDYGEQYCVWHRLGSVGLRVDERDCRHAHVQLVHQRSRNISRTDVNDVLEFREM